QTTGKASFPGSSDTFSLAGLSEDGTRAVLMRSTPDETVVVVSTAGSTSFTLPDQNWEFDALSGDKVYLLHYVKAGYEIRLFDLGTHVLQPKPLKDPKGASTIWGQAWERVASRDGRY